MIRGTRLDSPSLIYYIRENECQLTNATFAETNMTLSGDQEKGKRYLNGMGGNVCKGSVRFQSKGIGEKVPAIHTYRRSTKSTMKSLPTEETIETMTRSVPHYAVRGLIGLLLTRPMLVGVSDTRPREAG